MNLRLSPLFGSKDTLSRVSGIKRKSIEFSNTKQNLLVRSASIQAGPLHSGSLAGICFRGSIQKIQFSFISVN